MTARALTSYNNPDAPAETCDVRAQRHQEADAFPIKPYSALAILSIWIAGAALPLALVVHIAGFLRMFTQPLAAFFLLCLLAGIVTYVTSPRREC